MPAAPSLRTELLVTIGILAGAAVLVAVLGVMLVPVSLDTNTGMLYVGALLAGDVGVFVAFGAYQLRRLVTAPLDVAVAVSEAIAAGDLTRRLPDGTTREFVALSASVNRMTDNLLEEQAYRLRAEKLATVGRLAAGIAHEVGNPLGAIGGYAHILRRRVSWGAGTDPAIERAVRDALDGIEHESARIDRIVRGLLDYARPRRGTPAHADVNDVLRSSLALLGQQGVLRGVALDLALDPGALPLFGERHELEQVFVNVLLNAVDAVAGEGRVAVRTRRVAARDLLEHHARRAGDPAGTPAVPRRSTPRIERWLERAGQLGDVAHVVIADSGPGIPEEDAERVFDPFYTTKAPGKGTGLGLAIVARVVENLSGVVWVQRAREGGAAFVIVVPLSPAATAADAAPVVVPSIPAFSPSSATLASAVRA